MLRKKFLLCAALYLLLFYALAVPLWAQEAATAGLELSAEAAVLMEAHGGKVLWAKNADKELPMASVTKIMTLLLAVEAVEQGKASLEDRVVASENAWEMGGSQIYLEPGEEFSLREMLIAVAVGSANDASVALAEHLMGSEEAFVEAMNRRVQEMGLTHTRFANCTGLPAKGHYTSAYDMAVILREALKYPLFRQLSSIYEYDLRGGKFKLWNTNKLLKWYQGVDAGKTGWTTEAKYCLASSAERDGLRLIAVVLGVPEPRGHFRESIKLYNYGFARYRAVNLLPSGAEVARLPVEKGEPAEVEVITAGPVTVVVPRGEERGFTTACELPPKLKAPLARHQEVGYCIVQKGGQEVHRVPLLAAQEVKKAGFLAQINRVLSRVYGPGR